MPTERDRVENVVPALGGALEGSDPDLLDAAAIAVGRAVPRGAASAFLAPLEALLKSPAPSVRQSALLAYGLLGHRTATPTLGSVLVDASQGRRALGRRSAIGEMDRAFAAIALGLLRDPAAASLLLRQARHAKNPVKVRAAAVVALGCFVDQGPALAPELTTWLDDEKLDVRVRATVPIALARLGDAGKTALPALVRLAGGRHTDEHLRRTARKGRDAAARGFALVALGGLVERHFAEKPPDSAQFDPLEALMSLAREPASAGDRPFAALALGRAVHPLDATAPLRARVGRGLRRLFRRFGNPDESGAIALGLAHERDALGTLRDRFESSSDPRLRSELGLALALLRDGKRSEILRGFDCVALGRIAERSEVPWYEPFHLDANFLLPLTFQTELLDIY